MSERNEPRFGPSSSRGVSTSPADDSMGLPFAGTSLTGFGGLEGGPAGTLRASIETRTALTAPAALVGPERARPMSRQAGQPLEDYGFPEDQPVSDAKVDSAAGGRYDFGAEFRDFGALMSDGTVYLLARYSKGPKVRSILKMAEARGYKRRRIETVTAESLTSIYQLASQGKASVGFTASEIQRLWDRLLRQAVDMAATDIHIEVRDEGATVDFRIMGAMVATQDLSRAQGIQLLYSVFTLSETMSPVYLYKRIQNGRMYTGPRITLPAGIGMLRHNWAPVRNTGRYLNTRIHAEGAVGLLRISDQPFSEDIKKRLLLAMRRPYGLNLLGGPLGSGKTTLMRILMEERYRNATIRPNVVTVEDPIEHDIPWARLIAVPTDAENEEQRRYYFSETVASMLRMDFNWGMVGEIRDWLTAAIIMELVEIGRPMFTTLHFDSITEMIVRLRGLKVEKYRLVRQRNFNLITNQRLLPELCPVCALRADEATDAYASLTGAFLERMDRHQVRKDKLRFHKPEGCPQCNHLGYVRRMPVIEMLEPDEQILRMMYDEDTPAQDITDHWINKLRGVPLVDDAMRHISRGIMAPDTVEEACALV